MFVLFFLTSGVLRKNEEQNDVNSRTLQDTKTPHLCMELYLHTVIFGLIFIKIDMTEFRNNYYIKKSFLFS